jgi:uncharacterized protein (TIGR03067 family)
MISMRQYKVDFDQSCIEKIAMHRAPDITSLTSLHGKKPAHFRVFLFATFFLVILLAQRTVVQADVYVITNRQEQTIKFAVPALEKDSPNRAYDLPPGKTVAIQGLGQLPIYYQSEVGPIRTHLLPNSVYTFDVTTDSRLLLNQVDLGSDESTAAGTGVVHFEKLVTVFDIPVKIVVDDDEPAQQAQWEARLRKRVADASQILEQCCRIRLRIVSVGTWLSDNRLDSLDDAYAEFTDAVEPESARLVIGFTSQFPVPDKPGRVGLSSGLLRGHILMREGSRRATEGEMTEALLQEIGRVLGAVNQNAQNSIMRPGMLDGQARRKDFALQFDPVNLLLVNMLAEEIRRNDVLQLADLQPGTRARLKQIYTRLGLAPKSKPEPEVAQVPATAHLPRGTAEPEATATVPEKKKPGKRITPHPDLKKFQGEWKVVSAQRRGVAVPEVLNYKPQLKDDHLTLAAENLGTFKFRMDIDPEEETAEPAKATAQNLVAPKSSPIPFDLVMKIQDKNYIAHGIYEFDGSQLRICIARPGERRPTKFAAPAETDQALLVFKRPGS